MEYQALYRQFRPEVFEDMVGQDHIVTALKNQLESHKLAHAYLFCGTRGTGKTSTARILSRAVNCENPHGSDPCNECESCKSIINGSAIDVVEIDAASNTSVDNIREIRDEVAYPPAMLKYKVYIIDEVHMLSTGAFNALLKTLEEPPEHVIFILATTEYHKVPATILSRCQRFDFRRISSDEIKQRIRYVCDKSNSKIDDEACSIIAYAADGSMRDGLAILDKCISFGNNVVTGEIATKILGIVDDNALFDISEAISKCDLSVLIEKIENAIKDGRDPILLTVYLIEHFRCIMVAFLVKDPENILQMSKERVDNYLKQTSLFTVARIITIIRSLSNLYKSQKESPNPKVMLEIGLASICTPVENVGYEVAQQIKPAYTPAMSKPSIDNSFTPPIPDEAPPIYEEQQSPIVDNRIVNIGDNVIQSKWTEIVDYIRSDGKMMLYANIMLANPVEDNDLLNIVFKTEQKGNKEIIDTAENIKYIEQVIEYICGKVVKVKILLSDESKVKTVLPQSKNKAMDLAKKFPSIVSIDESEDL